MSLSEWAAVEEHKAGAPDACAHDREPPQYIAISGTAMKLDHFTVRPKRKLMEAHAMPCSSVPWWVWSAPPQVVFLAVRGQLTER